MYLFYYDLMEVFILIFRAIFYHKLAGIQNYLQRGFSNLLSIFGKWGQSLICFVTMVWYVKL